MKTKIDLNRNSLLPAICLAVAIFTATLPAYARSTSGFNSFHILSPSSASSCVTESWGAVVNNCTYDVTFVFDLPVDNDGAKTVSAVDYINGTGSFGCYAISFGQNGRNDYDEGQAQTFNGSGQQSLNFSTYVYPGWSLSLYCWSVPPGRGIQLLNWNP